MATAISSAALPEHGRPSTALKVVDSKLSSKEDSQVFYAAEPDSRLDLQRQDSEVVDTFNHRQAEVDEVTKEAVALAKRHEEETARLQAEAIAKQQAEIKQEADALAQRHAEENERLEADKLARRKVEEEEARKEQAEAAQRRQERAEAILLRREQVFERNRALAATGARPTRNDEGDSSGADDVGEMRSNGGTIIKNLFHGRSGSTSSETGKHHYRQLSQSPEPSKVVQRDSRSKQRAASQSQAREADLAEFLNKGPPVPLKPSTPEKSLPIPPQTCPQRKPVPRPGDESKGAASGSAGFPDRTVSLTKRAKPTASNAPAPTTATPEIHTAEAPLIAPKPVPPTSDICIEQIRRVSLDTSTPPALAPPNPTPVAVRTPDPSKVVPPTPRPSAAPPTTEERPLPLPPGSTPPVPPHTHRRKSSAQESARLRSIIANANAERDDAVVEVRKLKERVANAQTERDEARAEVGRVKDVLGRLLEELKGAEKLFDVFGAVTRTEAVLNM
ncbi:hypothetical protein Tdes44962_MAKER00695 [Teratosphaeria destructans]|uniref:Uncharacterized protein n=1 Tax=Teratosphaeria destructans TaxID=418781 RepID=A0A9W7SM02_9PEZI|nr:hypothetical protein Tdes44962_MAKER00695 [Teratosphaeria destructans]